MELQLQRLQGPSKRTFQDSHTESKFRFFFRNNLNNGTLRTPENYAMKNVPSSYARDSTYSHLAGFHDPSRTHSDRDDYYRSAAANSRLRPLRNAAYATDDDDLSILSSRHVAVNDHHQFESAPLPSSFCGQSSGQASIVQIHISNFLVGAKVLVIESENEAKATAEAMELLFRRSCAALVAI